MATATKTTRSPGAVRVTKAGVDKGRRLDIEDDLTNLYHVKWSYLPSISVDKIDVERSRHNQARFQAIHDKVVDEYAEAMKRGEHFPPVIAYTPGGPRDEKILVDGNHRDAATRQVGFSTCAMYLLDDDTDPKTIALMTYACNVKNGIPTTDEERIEGALFLWRNGSNVPAAAAAVGLPTAKLSKAISHARADERSDAMRFPRNKWDTIGSTIKTRLNGIKTDEGFLAATELVYAANLQAPQVTELVAEVNATASAKKQVQVVAGMKEAFLHQIQQNAGGVLGTANHRRDNPKSRAARVLGQALTLPEGEDLKVVVQAYAQAERADASKRFHEASVRLQGLADALADGS